MIFEAMRPLLHRMDPERAHALTAFGLSLAHRLSISANPDPFSDDPRLGISVFGLDFPNPIGMAAGFDKNATLIAPLLAMGFGFVEAGTVTLFAQPGNDRPRMFRLKRDEAVINRLGFNNHGAEEAAHRLEKLEKRHLAGPVGINMGVNKDSRNRQHDYERIFERLYGLADYATINISSPNTPGLRDLQSQDALRRLVAGLDGVRARRKTQGAKAMPLLIKVAPDLTMTDVDDIATIALEGGVDGLIISNTTITRPTGLTSDKASERGGLSGKPLMPLSTKMLAEFYRRLDNRLPLIGVGGIASGADAYEKIRHGASLIQLYTALIYQGPRLISHIKADLVACMEADKFTRLRDVVGTALNDSESSTYLSQ
ncbi:quinone-dependent dihydroorotate dehydrogenase [Yunchengibacter salinarum]|uniref:quinone-dependent dihydroorotate dehydrogenase n=1 Tax=Yunchengibacter salinarum TaxID=3133399 RepID=UPI0035B5B3F5